MVIYNLLAEGVSLVTCRSERVRSSVKETVTYSTAKAPYVVMTAIQCHEFLLFPVGLAVAVAGTSASWAGLMPVAAGILLLSARYLRAGGTAGELRRGLEVGVPVRQCRL